MICNTQKATQGAGDLNTWLIDAPEIPMYRVSSVLMSRSVLLFSKLNKIFFGYFDSENIVLDNENNFFSG